MESDQFYDSHLDIKQYNTSEKFYISRAEKLIGSIKKYKKNGHLLDIGTGPGYVPFIASRNGFHSTGIEISQRLGKFTKDILKQNVLIGDFNSLTLPVSHFDVITMIDILEHMTDPTKTLKKVHNILKYGGLLVIKCPNITSLAAALTGKSWSWLLIPFHLFHFSPTSLRKILESNQFKILEMYTQDDLMDLVINILWIIRVRKNDGKLKFLYTPLYYLLLFTLYPLSSIWSRLGRGGIINVYAVKE